jgi:hypothetical protein
MASGLKIAVPAVDDSESPPGDHRSRAVEVNGMARQPASRYPAGSRSRLNARFHPPKGDDAHSDPADPEEVLNRNVQQTALARRPRPG